MNIINEKKLAGETAAQFVENGMTIGLGTGSTVRYTIEKIASRIKKDGLMIQGVPTSLETKALAESLEIPLVSLQNIPSIDLTIDGADEVNNNLDGIKGGGGALLFEKIVASVSKRNIWVADSSKKVDELGKFPLPVEVVPFASPILHRKFTEEGMKPILRMAGGHPFETDSGNWVIDLHLRKISEPNKLTVWLNLLTGVVENGLFMDHADVVVVAFGEIVHQYERKP